MQKINRSKSIKKLFNDQCGKCYYCKKQMTLDLGYQETAEKDHIIPKSLGGSSKKFNIVAACHRCNRHKGNKYPFPK